jgi:hypothetical protein
MSESVSNEVVLAADSLRQDINALSKGQVNVFTTLEGNDFQSKVAVLDALTNAEPLQDNIGTVINLKHVVIQAVDMPVTDTKGNPTGEIQAAPRIILIDADGKSYHAMSTGLFKSLENIFGIVGMPTTWPEPLPIVVDKVKGKVGSFFTARVALAG